MGLAWEVRGQSSRHSGERAPGRGATQDSGGSCGGSKEVRGQGPGDCPEDPVLVSDKSDMSFLIFYKFHSGLGRTSVPTAIAVSISTSYFYPVFNF